MSSPTVPLARWKSSGGDRAGCKRAAERTSTRAGGRPAPGSISPGPPPTLSFRSSARIPRWPSTRRFGSVAGSLVPLGLAGCLYSFAGGGLPNIKTVAILPFDNDTPQPTLTNDVTSAVTDAVENRLGLRAAAQSSADAVVRGRVVRYDPDVPLAFQPGVGAAVVTQRQVQLTVDVEILDQRSGRTLWQRQGLSLVGEYTPPQETDGRKIALQKLENEIVDGAQSQW